MANYAAEVPTEQGITPTFRVSSASDTVPGGVVLDVRNTGTICTVTVTTPQTVSGDLAVAERVVSVPATTGEKVILIPNNPTYVDQTTGLVTVTFSPSGAPVTYSVLRLS